MCRGVWSGVSVCVYVSVGVAGTVVKVLRTSGCVYRFVCGTVCNYLYSAKLRNLGGGERKKNWERICSCAQSYF